jgi:hypothetical protein
LKNDNLLNEYLRNHFEKELEIGEIDFISVLKARNQFTRTEDSTLLLVISKVQKVIKVNRLDKKSSIIELQISDPDEDWAFLMSTQLLYNAKKLYSELKIGKSVKTLEALESRVDSVQRVLDALMGAVALEADQNQSLVMTKARVPGAKKQLQIQLLTAMYGELVKNVELTRFTLEREEPLIQIIDSPTQPLYKKGKNRIFLALLGAFILTTFSILYILAKRWFNQLMEASI